MDSKLNLRGAYTALVTPFDDNGNVDEDALRGLIQRQVAGGVAGIVPCGTTGEGAALSLDEHEMVVRVAVEEAARRIQVIAGAGSNNTSKAIEISRRCQRAGANALLHVTPYYVKPTQEGLIAHFTAIADAVDLPIVLYNVPSRTAVTMEPATVAQLAEDARFVGIKQAVTDLSQLEQIASQVPPEFALLSGEDSLTVPMIALGAHGVIAVVSNQVPADMAKLVEAALAGQREKAIAIQRRLQPLMAANFVQSNPIPVKWSLAQMGLIENRLRLPLTPLSQKHQRTLLDAMEKAGLHTEPASKTTGKSVAPVSKR